MRKKASNFYYDGVGWARFEIVEMDAIIHRLLSNYSDKQLNSIKYKGNKGDPNLLAYLQTLSTKILAERKSSRVRVVGYCNYLESKIKHENK